MSSSYHRYQEALANIPSPALVVDLDAFDNNIKWVVENAGGKKIRVATKSLRSLELIKRVLSSSQVFQGLMTFTLAESLWLRELGFADILMGYPTTDKQSLERLAENPEGIVLMVDLPEHLDYLNNIAQTHQTIFSICLDLDLSTELPGIRFGVYRSSLHTLERLKALLEKLKTCPHLKLVGSMGYEAQIAGLGDKNSPLIRFLKKRSLKELQKRRQVMNDLIFSYGHKLAIVNGGGTGSLKETRKEPTVTEVTVGSGFYSPGLFDHYQDFSLTPAMFFTLPVVRHPEKNIYTALGGGYIASGSQDPSKLPVPYLPAGIKLLKHEGAGEVQTPFKYHGELKLGDIILMRHAKAGEACERFERIHLLQNQNYLKDVKTYRGEGKAFL